MGKINSSQHLLPICISRLATLAVFTKAAFSFRQMTIVFLLKVPVIRLGIWYCLEHMKILNLNLNKRQTGL